MNTDRAIKRLTDMLAAKQRAIELVRRKRSLRVSEKAMWLSSLVDDIEALRLALNTIEERAKAPLEELIDESPFRNLVIKE